MGQPGAKENDTITAVDIHIILVPALVPVPTPIPHPFSGMLDGNLSTNVNIMGKAAATVGSTATNKPSHIPIGGPFAKPPTNQGRIVMGSATVFINSKPAARSGDIALTCNDPVDLPVGTVTAAGSVMIG
jgi:uncharacterized Zn-binding protein involved in type VI secretion